jgi:ankyrin repeat protein
MNNFRLDRRRDAMKGGTMAVIGPGNSAGSRLYLRLLGTQYGKQMPLTGALNPEQIDIIKTWIDQGAEWPDDVSGETVPPPPDPRATRMMETLRRGDRQSFEKMLADDPKVASLRGPGGSTPLMYAVLYGNSETVRALLDSGADPSIRNDAGATALMWAADDIDKMRLLLERGADANARSDDGRTPLMIAAGRFGSSALVKLLLDHGANPSAKCPGLITDKTPLSEAAYAGDEAVVGMLIERGADIKSAGFLPLSFALRANSAKCVDMLIKSASREVLNIAMFIAAPPLGDAHTIKLLLDRGADVNAKDPAGRTILMLAACSDALPVETVKTLIERGADVNAKSATGETALDLAKQRGETTIVDLLIKAGAKQSGGTTELAIKPKPATSVRTAIERSIPLLQRTDVAFIQKSACVSCHHNTLTAMTVATARKNGLPINDDTARAQLKTIASYIDTWRERLLQGIGIPGDADTVSYFLLGMAAEKYAPDASTDALARYLRSRQSPEGHWLIFAHRPPLESSNIEVTATSMRAIQVYAPEAQRSEYERAVQLAAGWLIKAQPKSTEDRAFQILGLAWAGANKDVIRKAARELLSEQRPDGGWAQLPSLVSDAYATGQALVALKEAGALAATTPAYRRGTQFLLNSQLEDGSWYVKSRALPIQPFFESGFPHGHDQWISAAATNWATMALAHAAR